MHRSRAKGRTVILLLIFQLVPDPLYLRWPCEFVDLQHHHFGFRRHPRPKVVNNIRFTVAFHKAFIGRTREKRRLLKDISDTQVSAVCILGKPGIGKTRFAIEAVQDAKADVKWLITADSRVAVKQGLMNLAVEMELSDPLIHDGDKLALDWLANAEGWILVLDNVQSFDDLTDLLPARHRGTIVATAAHRFVCPSEVNSISLRPLGKREASELLQKHAHRKDDSGARKLASVLAGFPVALVQAASLVSASNLGFEPFAQQFPRLQISPVARVPLVMERRYRIIGRVLWQKQREFLENEGLAASICLVQFMSTLSPKGVSKRLLARLTGFDDGKYQEAVSPLNSLSIVRMDSSGSSCRLHWLSQHGILAELVQNGNASMLQTVLEGLMQPVGKQWWYPASFYRVSKVVFEHGKFLLNNWHLKLLSAKARHSDKLANLTCQARVAVGGYAYYNLADARLGRQWMQKEIARWPSDSLQHGVCSALLALVTSDSDRKASRRFDEFAVDTVTRIRDDSEHDETLAVYVYVLANSLRLAAGDRVDASRQQRRVDELKDHITQLEPEPRAHVHCSLGRWYQYREELDLALRHTRACRRILRAHPLAKVAESSMELSIAYTSERLAALFLAFGQFRKAIRRAREASLLFELVFGPNHRRRARSLVSLGLAAAEVHGPDKGLPHCQRALKILQDQADDTTATAKALLCRGKFSRPEADPCRDLAMAQKLFEQINGAEHLDTVQCRIEHARCMLDRFDQTRQVEQLVQKDFERLENRNETLPRFFQRQLLVLHADIWRNRANQATAKAEQYWQRADALRPSTILRSILGIVSTVTSALACAACLPTAAFRFKRPSAKPPALVVANSHYVGYHQLPAACNDGEAVRALFADAGYDVIHMRNATLDDMNSLVKQLLQHLSEKEHALVPIYLSGHGIEHHGLLYFAPVDAEKARLSSHLLLNSLQLSHLPRVAQQHSAEPTKSVLFFFFLDICRTDVQLDGGSMEPEQSLLRPSKAPGVVYFKACARGKRAFDEGKAQGKGRGSDGGNGSVHGRFTRALLDFGQDSRLTLGALSERVGLDVKMKSGGWQVPEVDGPQDRMGEFLHTRAARHERGRASCTLC